MKIVLIRHGKPVAADNPRLSAVGFARWIRRYNASQVAVESRPAHINSEVQQYHALSSDLTRAIHSGEIYCGSPPVTQSKLFREMDIPRYRLPFTLKAWTWVYLCRVLWTLGFPGPFESYKDGKVRAREAALQLINEAQQRQNVVLFAHGYINLHIRRELKKRGWKVSQKSNQYWGMSMLHKPFTGVE